MLENHCNRQEISDLLDFYKKKKEESNKIQKKVYKRIEADFFKIPAKK